MRKLVVAVVALVVMASSAMAGDFDGKLVFAGSSTLAPVISEIAKAFGDSYGTWDKVDQSLPAEKIQIFVSGGGSGAGAKAILDGSANFGMLSRPASENEKQSIPGYTQYFLGTDALTISVNPENQVCSLRKGFTSEELRKIFSGEISKWKELDDRLPNEEIVVVVRDLGGGAHGVFQQAIMGESQVRKDAIQAPSMGALVTKIIENPRAIGYASFGIVNQNSGKLIPMAVDDVEPTASNITSGAYSISRPLMVISKGELSPTEKSFSLTLTDSKAMEIVDRLGFVPAR